MAARYDMTLNQSLGKEPAGIRVRGIAEHFESSMSNPLDPTRFSELGSPGKHPGVRNETPGRDELSGRPAELFSFGGLAYDIFPPLPDDVADAAGTWANTVTWHTDSEELEGIFTGAYT